MIAYNSTLASECVATDSTSHILKHRDHSHRVRVTYVISIDAICHVFCRRLRATGKGHEVRVFLANAHQAPSIRQELSKTCEILCHRESVKHR